MKYILVLTVIFTGLSCYSQTEEQLADYEYFLNKGGTFLYADKDSAYVYLSKSYKVADESNYLDGKLNTLTYLVQANGYHFDLKKLNQNLRTFEKVLKDEAVDTLTYGAVYQRRFLLEKGQYFYKINNYQTALRYFNELVNDLTRSKSSGDDLMNELNELYSAYSFIAAVYEKSGKYSLSKEYHNKTLSITEAHPEINWSRHILNTRMRLARVYENESDYLSANELLNEVLPVYISQKENPRFKNNILSTYQRLSKNYLLQDSIVKAINTLKESEVYYSENDPFKRSADMLYGDIHIENKEFDKAEAFYQSYLMKTKSYRQDEKHQDVAEAFSKLGRLYVAKNNPQKALEFYQESLMQIAPNFNDNDIKNNPDPKKVLSKLELVKVLKEKLEALQLLYKNNNKIEVLNIAFSTSYDIIKTLDLLKPEFESKVDKQFLISEMYPAFHSMVAIAYDLYEVTKEPRYIDDAFYFFEKSKSVLLLEAARSTQASSYGGVPEEIVDREQQFRANIIHLEKKFFNQKSNMVVFDSLFQLKNKYYNFISDIEQNYPKYYDLKYNADVVSLEETANQLIEDKALLSYFSTSTDLFLITIEKNKKEFFKIPLGSKTQNRITYFYSLLSKININDLPEIYETGYSIYDKILKSPLDGINAKELIIIPDGILNYLPFEALSTSKDNANYLIKEYQISYTNSSTLLREQQNKLRIDENKLLAYAPSFEIASGNVSQNRPDFGSLLYNKDEVNQITKFFNGRAVIGDEASLKSFSENSQKYNMLHFATHAATNDQYPDYSYLAFAPDSKGETSLLYVKDLYGYSINADLVALSACQTGLGKLQNGEGMLSLARGFSYAGAKSLVTTLWKINDQTTSELMQEFYKNLNKSLSKDEALRNAKLTYLTNADDELLTHPYYWSGFMISGDTTPLQKKTPFFWWLLLLGIPVLLVVVRKIKK
ncbi:CHAT domain-containing protein [Aquimarina amphilecti]|uniref:CHAT domain-containing protein n=1 Tax=Aquimarina amphilecti TaxID=1038014 RepID=A0A1H7NNI8_AQUAM|nr:CHAT domain-containing tetratricopeptide repeat protein [Aquimarina amphilecti]SEL25092.1 CHAT domain-containing protein [Aquimarina amphilecti]